MMKRNRRRNQIVASLIAFLLVISMLLGTAITAFADEVKIVTLGADLSDEQRELILNYFNVDENDVEIITVTNDDEHFYLDGIATQQQIGKRTFSCTYIEPTNDGGIHIKTVNLNWVTCDMIRNALVTSGITNCNVICASPKEVSGTGALTGIFMAYAEVTGEELDEEKVELASQELVETMSLSKDIGQEEATALMSLLKEQVIVDGLNTVEEIGESLEAYVEENNIELTEEQKDALIQLMLNISKQDYSVEEVKQAYQDIKDTVQSIKDTTEATMNFLEKAWNWIVTAWQKITGTYEEVMATEEAQMIKDQLGILAQTNDELLGEDTVVTITEEQSLLDDAVVQDAEITEEKTGVLESIKTFFKEFFGGTVDEEQEQSENIEETEQKDVVTFENIQELVSEEYEEEFEAETETEIVGDDEKDEAQDDGILGYVNWEMQNGTDNVVDNNTSTPSLDDLTN